MAEETKIWEQYGELGKAFQLYSELAETVKEAPTLKSSYHIGIAGVYIKQLRMEDAKKELDHAKELMPRDVDTINSAYLYTGGRMKQWQTYFLKIMKPQMN